LSLAFLSKLYAVTDWNRYSEVHGTPVRVGTHPAQANADEKAQFHSDLSNLAADATITMPEGWALALVEAKVGSGEVFEKLIDWADKAIAIAVLGQNLTTDVEGGSFAAAQVHENVRQDLIDGDTETLATTMHDQVVSWWAEFNLGERGLAPWPDWDSAPPADQVQLATALNGRAEAILKLAQAAAMTGLPIDWKAMAEAHDLPLLEGAEVVPPAPPRPVGQALRLASGDNVDAAGSFVAGQLYTDELIDVAKARGGAAMRPVVQRVLELVDNATSYEELREQLLSEYEHLDVDELRSLTQSTVTLALLAGRLAVVGGDE
jgi:phage gp29-like protein